ncbi:Protein of unknown function [Desulfacinum hydrothermale DSM 13146]|uniref:DUF721 domain-containing protein n=2 Tax=Desulfacinum hydrothermale TaxID=109258 RepID=A0A1W1X953_9BACT|nr:Protein of unknown function [Desulfacinum hydrothermale DSM 13146]
MDWRSPEEERASRAKIQAEPLRAFVKEVLARHPSFASNPLGDWKDLVGEHVARHTVPRSLKNGRLVIVARDGVWKHHLEINKEALRERINALWKKEVVRQIAVRVGEVEELNPELDANYRRLQKIKSKKVPRRRKKPTLRPLTPEEKKLLASLSDPELKKMGERLLRLTPAEADSAKT